MSGVERGRSRIKFTSITSLQRVPEVGVGGKVGLGSCGLFGRGNIGSPPGNLCGECLRASPVKLGAGDLIVMCIFAEEEFEIVISAGLLREFPGGDIAEFCHFRPHAQFLANHG